jgi:hypothetical protein
MRPLDKEGNRSPEQILEGVRQAAQRLPDRLPDEIAGLDRRRYREARKEEG